MQTASIKPDQNDRFAVFRAAYPNATEDQIKRLVRAEAEIDRLSPPRRAAAFDGEPIDAATADELRQLGRPKLKLNFGDRRAAA